MIKITLPDSSVLESPDKSSLFDIIGQIGTGLQKAALFASVDGENKDLTFVPQKDFALKVFTFKNDEGREMYWHSTSHIMAQAVKRLFPDVKVAIGPAIAEGFYYDFDVKDNFTPEDLDRIEAEMNKVISEDIEVTREELSREDAIKLFEKDGEIYKVELLKEMDADTVSIYRQGDFYDLCRGPHVMRTSQIKAVKLLKNAGAYWRGSEKNKMLQRIYGISFPDKKELDKHINLLEEAKERDHRKIGKELGLFEFSNEVGQGLALWTAKGGRIRHAIETFWKKEHYKNGYELVNTPHIGRSLLWETSGHLDFYKEGMYSPMDIDGEDYYVKPMNCPFHVMLYKAEMRSYRDFPFKWAELGTVYRYEKSGTLHGLLRVRGFTQDDAHLFCRVDQMESEITETFNFSMYMLKSFGFEEFQIYLSTKPEESVGSSEIWEKAESALKHVLDKSGMDYQINEGDGAFYGPKIDIAVKDAIGRKWQLSTIQCDFNLPERFDITYKGSDGNDHRPIMIHRALLGSLERFFGILIEHYKGAFPFWLAPVQVKILNVNEESVDYINSVKKDLRSEDFRVDTDFRNESISYKIREAVQEKIPYVLVAGNKEVESGSVSVRIRGENNAKTMTLNEFKSLLKKESK
ncbi:MAG: threonine--tRNA ligase [Spirochaetes bacterium]|nr:threonine--tRNA ligase [Spirochaetota bacterium]